MTRRAHIAALLSMVILAAAGCASRRCAAPAEVYRVELDDALESQGVQGIHYPGAGVIGINPEILDDRGLARTVVAHEVGHALGCAHTTEPGTLMYPAHGPGEAPIDGPTPGEVEQARSSAGRRIALRLPARCGCALIDAAGWARDVWNRALRAPVLSVERISLDSR